MAEHAAPHNPNAYTEVPAAAYYGAMPTPEHGQHAAPAPQGQHAAPDEAAANANPEGTPDARPALATVAPNYGASNEDSLEGVDAAHMPEFKDMRRMLPAERLAAQFMAAKVAKAMPSGMLEKFDGLEAGTSLDDLDTADLDALVGVINSVQGVVLDNAADREAMAEWLRTQDNGMNAVMYAFTVYTEKMGN